MLAALVDLGEGGEQKIGGLRREVAARRREGGIQRDRPRLLHGPGFARDILQLVERAVIVEWLVRRVDARHDLEPFERLGIALARSASSPNIANPSGFQPQTMLSPARPFEAWSTVASALAANTGCTIGTCTVENSAIFSVTPREGGRKGQGLERPFAAVISPPKPFQRAIGRKNSKPARSAMRETSTISCQIAGQRSGTRSGSARHRHWSRRRRA